MSIADLKRENADLKRENTDLKRENADLKRENADLKPTNLELQNQIKLMQTIFDSLSEGVVASSLEGEFFIANPIAEEIVGMEAAEGDGTPTEWSEIYGTFYPDKTTLVPSTELPLYRAMRGEVTNDVKLFTRNQARPDGSFMNVSGRPLFDENNNLIGGVITIRDITQLENVTQQLKTTINELQNQNALRDAIFNSMSEGVIVADKDGKYVMVNKAVTKRVTQNLDGLHAWEASDVFGLLDPENKETFPADKLPLAQALRGERPDNIEIRVDNPQSLIGMDVSISARPIYDENREIQGAVSVIRNISERKAFQTQLMAMNDHLEVQSKLLRSIFNSISDSVFVTDENGRIIMANPSARQMSETLDFKIESDTWIEKYNFFYPDKVTEFPIEDLPILRVINGEAVNNVEIFINSDDLPEGRHLDVSGNPLSDNEGNYTGGVLTFHDMTERFKTQEAVAQAFAQGRLEIVDTILHNIGNAINSVTVGIDTLHNNLTNDKLTLRLTALADAIQPHQDNFSDYIKNDPQGQKVLPFILALSDDFNVVKQHWTQTVDRIRARVGHIVDIIRTQNSYHGLSTTRKDINLVVAISDAIKILQNLIDAHHIHISVDCQNAPKDICIQESQFHQMFVNLIKNAIEAIGDLSKTGELTESPSIQIHCYLDGDFLHIDITDNGIGIAPEDTDKIFSAGFTTKENGSGLGLHSSANFVISCGGKIQALSDGKRKGTTIRIMLKYAAIQPSTPRNLKREENI